MNEAHKFIQALEGELTSMVLDGYDIKCTPLRLSQTNEIVGVRVEFYDGSMATFMRELIKK